MASQSSMTIQAAILQEDEYDDGDDHHPHPHNLSRLSMCTSNSILDNDDEEEEDEEDSGAIKIHMSRLSIESFDGDADEEFSDEKDLVLAGMSSDSDKEPGCYSLPATPPRRRNRGGSVLHQVVGVKEYASENEAQKGIRRKMTRNRRRRVIRERWVRDNAKRKLEEENGNSVSGESEGGVMLITRPKGGGRSLYMDLEEVKACKDLGFELEHERMTLEMPTRFSLSQSTLDTSSGGNSPISSWRISSPGDDPRDVKARLKVWAQAVALASTSRHSN